MRGTAVARKSAIQTKSKPKTKTTKKFGRAEKKTPSKPGTRRVERGGRKRDRREDDEDEGRGRFEPQMKKADSTPIVIAIVAGVLLVVLAAVMASGDGSSIVDEREAAKAYNYVDGQYAMAKGGDALAENRVALRGAFQKVLDTFPGTEAAKKAEKRIRELQ
jgi:hypothetical protein